MENWRKIREKIVFHLRTLLLRKWSTRGRNLPRRSKDIPVRWVSSILTEEKSAAAWLCRRRCAPVHHVPAKTVIVHARLSVRESLREWDWVLLREMMQRYGFPPQERGDRVLLKANHAIRVLSSGFRVPVLAVRPSTDRHSDSLENEEAWNAWTDLYIYSLSIRR